MPYRPGQTRWRFMSLAGLPANRRPSPSQPLFPGGQIRQLTSVPDALPAFPGTVTPPTPAAEPPRALGGPSLPVDTHGFRESCVPDVVAASSGITPVSSLGVSTLPAAAGSEASIPTLPACSLGRRSLPVGRHGFSFDITPASSSGASTLPAAAGPEAPDLNLQVAARSPKTPRRRKPRDKALIRVARGPKIELKHRQSGDISLNHHESHCAICQHPERDLIEQAFLHWQRSSSIAYEFQLADRRVVYRHARAFGLYLQRASRTRRALEFIIEQAETVTATADSVIRAVKAHACLREDGHWTEPVKRVVITHQYANYPDPQMTRLDEVASLAGCRLAAPPAKSVQPPQKAAAAGDKFLGTLLRAFTHKDAPPENRAQKEVAIA